ncbi:MAG: SPOR domain-containing protein [Gammaproteobacteria bacterium]|nr:SPOR domain-containing protein [Gammaproteobacteria bacterium]
MSSSNSYPGWAYLLAGVAMGLFVAFLVYLKNLPEQNRRLTDKQKQEQHSAPTFDFYTILPELEVVVPELEVLKGKQDKSAQPATNEKRTDSAELTGNEAFVLQIGSFKENQQADKLKASLALIGLEAHIQKVRVDNNTWHRVRLGPFDNRKTLNAIRQRLKENDLPAITLKVSG